jgi:NAD(P)-dependent dehydrogenase (short-subunit alcohol dehydrogenase family)
MKNYLDLTGKVALITGGSSGIGAAAAAVMADLGARTLRALSPRSVQTNVLLAEMVFSSSS